MNWHPFRGWQADVKDIELDVPTKKPEPKPERVLCLADFAKVKPDRHRGKDSYTGVTHVPVDFKQDFMTRSYKVTCSCLAVLTIDAMEVQ